ncbi:uncharacterized protein LOC113240011 [Hyposmocoma kahamanoa]|uniref:uncharacterized protein LOC113240011 n=1 Tax=Hyposmocoma kahamanoa TaxID=1477025 RepID=UPI000E6DA087|nr:uncharacterized protein LOC113240011 [Hyposmocoma kahamanoa]
MTMQGGQTVTNLDIAKAFDRVRHKALLSKLKKALCTWIASFLSERSLKVYVDGLCLDTMLINADVPQGSVLSPTLKAVTLKKVNSKYVLKSTLTPRLARKELQKELQDSSPQLSKSRSCTSLNQETSSDPAGPAGYNNYLTVHSFPSALNLPIITTQSYDDQTGRAPTSPGSDGSDEPPKPHTWTTMTPQEIATWIDKRSRVLFPCMFICFNLIYWTFVYCL